MKVWAKVCGITRVEDADVAIAAGADALGVNFHPPSPRCCDRRAAAAIVKRVAHRVTVYGLFVDARREDVEAVIAATGIDGIQFHGSEPLEALLGWDLPVLRAVRATSRDAVREALQSAHGYRVLVDSPRGGGSGTQFDPALVEGVDLSGAVVAGGLTPANVAERVARFRPFGVDVASGVEVAPGIKDAGLVREFVKNAKSAG